MRPTPSQSLKVRVVAPCSIPSGTRDNPLRLMQQQTRGEVEIARLQRSLMHDRLTNAQTRHVLDQLDEAYMQLSPVEYARQRKEMGLVRRRPASVADLQAQLRPGEALVEYVMDEKGSYAIEISRAGLKIHNLPAARRNQ